jgi:hypothetical protein
MKTTTHREFTRRVAALSLAALMTVGILGSVEMMAAAPAPAGLLARVTAPALVATTAPVPPATAARS